MSQSLPGNAEAPNPNREIPEAARGLCWGGFFLTWIWAIVNRTWIGLLCLVPFLGIVMRFVLLFKGREWAWKSKKWESVEEFNQTQKMWSIAGLLLFLAFLIGIVAAIAIPNYVRFQEKAQQSEAKTALAVVFGSEQAWHSEYGAFTNDLKKLSLNLVGMNRYRIGFADSDPSLAQYCGDCVAGKDTFKAVAVGKIGSAGRLDVWTIDQDRRLTNVVDGTRARLTR